MLVDAWWFNNTQNQGEILQPDFLTPKTHLGLYAEGLNLEFPVHISVAALSGGATLYDKQITVNEANIENDEHIFDICMVSGVIIGTIYTETLNCLPEHLKISVISGKNIYQQNIQCEYATLTGKITDFSGKPFPAAVKLYRVSFGGEIGTWSNINGEYSVTCLKVYTTRFISTMNPMAKPRLKIGAGI